MSSRPLQYTNGSWLRWILAEEPLLMDSDEVESIKGSAMEEKGSVFKTSAGIFFFWVFWIEEKLSVPPHYCLLEQATEQEAEGGRFRQAIQSDL